MPVYQYIDTKHSRVVELVRPVADRDLVPAGLERITVPQRIAISGTTSTPIDPHSADSTVPKAFKDLEQKVPAREIARESGFSVEKIKKVWNI